MRAIVLPLLVILACSLEATGQSPSPSSSTAELEGELKLVVAVFRHGVRAPLPAFNGTANDYSAQKWPDIQDWRMPPDKTWGDLTSRGQVLATALGNYYATWYRKKAWNGGFKVYLWADTDPRTIDTADALSQGFVQGGLPSADVTFRFVASKLDCPTITPDPLFHPFRAKCGVPDPTALDEAIKRINRQREDAETKYASNFDDLYNVLKTGGTPHILLKDIVDKVEVCKSGSDPCKPCDSPITWSGLFKGNPSSGQFPYASSASEAFLLEYANTMPPNQIGWGAVDAAKNLHSMMQLHEFYFKMTEQDPYLAKIAGSNLTREIVTLLDRKAGRNEKIDGECPRGDKESQFIGLVGHDTNLADVGALLKLSWKFSNASLPPGETLPPDTLGLPDNDALPAGALVFELREGPRGYRVRVNYVAQSLLQMRGKSDRPPTEPYRFKVVCQDEKGAALDPCEISLHQFEAVVAGALGDNNPFLSGCANGNEVCQ